MAAPPVRVKARDAAAIPMGDPDAAAVEDAPLTLYAPSSGQASGAGAGDAARAAAPALASRRRVPTVDFPGLNVPPPAGADLAMWGWGS